MFNIYLYLMFGIWGLCILVIFNKRLRSYAFTACIVGITLTGILYPNLLTSWFSFKLTTLIVPLLQISMFGMGVSLHPRDFIGVIKSPKLVGIGLVCQYTIMPFVGLGIGLLFSFSPEILAGLVLLGASPSGVTSNVMTYVARGNLALSISLTSIGTLLSPMTTPLILQLLAGAYVPIDVPAMMWDIFQMIILPVFCGVMVNMFFHKWAEKIRPIMPVVAMAAIVLIVGIVTAAGRDNLLQIGIFLILSAIIHNISGFALGYYASRLLGADEQSARTISIEVGLQNSGLASGLALQMGKLATMGLPSVIFSSWMNFSGSFLSNWWRNHPPQQAHQQKGSSDA